MKRFKIRFTPEAARLISKMHPDNKKMITAGLEQLRQAPYSGTALHAELAGYCSFRLKRYRVLYRINEEEGYIEILYVGHRRDVYEQFRILLNKLQG